MSTFRIHAAGAGVVALSLALVAAGCGSGSSSSSGSSSGGRLPAQIELVSIQDLSGTSGPGGQSTRRGMEVAVKEINETKMLGGTQLSISFLDSATDPTKAANHMTQAATGKAPIIFGSFTSGSALAEAPIAQRQKVPTIFTQAGAAGVLAAGDYIYRATPLQTSYFQLTLEHLKNKSVKKAAVIYDTDVPTIVDLAKTFQDKARDYGFEVVDVEATTSKTVDVSSQISKMLAAKADAVFVDVLLAHNVQVIKQLRQAGFTGLVVAQQGAGGGVLKPLGAGADGVVLATDFNAGSPEPAAKRLAERYKAQFNEEPGNFAAEGYDAVLMAATALKEANSADRAQVLTGLQKVAAKGFDGALGKITFKERQEISPGILVEIRNGNEVPIPKS